MNPHLRTGNAIRRVIAPSIATLALGLSLAACGDAGGDSDTDSDTGAKLSGTLNGAGSSAQEAAMGIWRSGFQTDNPDVTVNYDPSGSGAGREQFIAGGVQFAGSDAYLTDEELAASKDACGGVEAFDIPSYVSPIAVVYNLPDVDLQLSASTIANIFNGTIKTWDDAAIKADNPDATLPSTAIAPVHRADKSGTQKNFTEYLSKAAGGAWTAEVSDAWPADLPGQSGQGTSGVVDTVKNGAGTIGFADESQAGDLQIAKIKVGEEWVAPSAEGAAKVVDVSPRAQGRPAGDIAIDIDRTTTEAGAYPLILVSYLIGCPTYADANDADLVKGFLSYVVSADGQAAAASEAGSAPLSDELSSEAADTINKIAAK